MVDDVLVRIEDAVRQPVVAHELPDVLHRVQLGRAGRQEQERDVVGNCELGRDVPAGLVEDQNRVGCWINSATDLLQMRVHGAGVAVWHDETGALALCRAGGAEDVGPLCALIVRR